MWIFSKYGFFSVVCARKNDGLSPEIDFDKFMIRARSKNHIENLINNFKELKDLKILTTEDADYKYRIFVPKNTWNQIMMELSADIDYGNFKNAAYKFLNDKKFCSCLGDIWSIMYNYQNE